MSLLSKKSLLWSADIFELNILITNYFLVCLSFQNAIAASI